jgi:molybdate transport system ATP-binding protein
VSLRFDLRFGKTHAVGEVPPGVTGLLGHNGAGKTTLLMTLAGLHPAAGTLHLDGQPLHDLPTHARSVGVVFQDLRLFPHLTVAQNLAYGSPDAIEPLAEQLGLTALLPRAVPSLSGGEAQRVAIARALARKPRWLLLDEPFSALDPATRRQIVPWLHRALLAANIPCLLVTHHPHDLLQLTRRLYHLQDGQLRDACPLDGSDPDALREAHAAGVDMVIPIHDDTELRLPPRPQGATSVALRPEDVLITRPPFGPTSARNAFDGVVHAVIDAGGTHLVQVDAVHRWTAALTTSAVEELAIRPGAQVRVWIKTTAFRWV